MGNVNPSGRLPVTFPARIEDNPSFYNHPGDNQTAVYGEGIFIGYRHYDAVKSTPLFPFGFGLSYTSFEYSDVNLSTSEMSNADEIITVSFDVTNVGNQAGKSVAQIYVQQISRPGLRRPERELKGWNKLDIRPGETVQAVVSLDKTSFAYWDDKPHCWVVDPGAEFQIFVGQHSRDLGLSTKIKIANHARVEKGELIGRWTWS